jgi:hypothetical protein
LKNLIADLDDRAGKTALQTYKIQHGIERIEVLVPVKNAAAFEAAMKQPIKTRAAILEVLYAHAGELKK